MDGRMEVGIGASTLLSVCRDDYLLLLLLKNNESQLLKTMVNHLLVR